MTSAHRPFVVVLALSLAPLCACEGSSPTCAADDECAAAERCSDGACVAAAGGEGEGEGEPAGCRDDGDGALTNRELPLALDTPLRMLEASDDTDEALPVDVVGHDEAGVRVWDFSAPYADDVAVQVQAQAIDGRHWFRADVDDLAIVVGDGDTLYAAKLDEQTWGVFVRTPTDLFIHAVASDTPDDTFIAYDPPIRALVYPLQDGATFSSTSDGHGTFQGNAFYCSTDTYESTVSGRGVARTAAGDFPVARVLTHQTVVVDNCFGVPLLVVERRQAVFVSACTGAVVSVTSAAGETDAEFATASRVRRVGLPE